MADPQHFTAEHDQQGRTEAVGFGAEEGGLDHVDADFQPAVGLQRHQFPQMIGLEAVVRFGQAQFPGVAGMFDRSQRRGSGAAFAARDDT